MKTIIENAWKNRINGLTEEEKTTVRQVLKQLETGEVRSAVKSNDGNWTADETIKKAILLSFRLQDNEIIQSGEINFYDKVPLQFAGIEGAKKLAVSGSRLTPFSVVRNGAHIASKVIMMTPSYVNIGAYVDESTMVDSFALIGSCAQIGKNCHISAHVTIGGVLEPINASPVIVEDNCMIGAGCRITQGAVVKQGAYLAENCVVNKSIHIYDMTKGAERMPNGVVPANAVCVPGSKELSNGISQACLIIKGYKEKNIELNEILR